MAYVESIPGIYQVYIDALAWMFLVFTRYIPGICPQFEFGIHLVYTRYIPYLEIHGYIPGIYLVYTSYFANMVTMREYTRYIPGKCHFYRFQMYIGRICILQYAKYAKMQFKMQQYAKQYAVICTKIYIKKYATIWYIKKYAVI